ncbi:MAG: hypothetical protein EOM83_08090, partial [Clostridia bacterium]|nr:hypothetical protein [Clostridia bacterium]
MKQITSLWLLLFFMASTTLIAQNTSTGSAAQKAATAKYKTEQQNLNAKVQPEMISGVKQGSEADKSPMEARRITNSTDEQWDVLYTFSAQAPSSQAIATDGENFYLTYWNGTGLFDKFDMDGSYISSFTISGAAAIRDLAYDGTYFYGAPSGGMTIAKLDLANQTLVSTFAISSSAGVTGSRHLSYDPELSASGGFWLGQWGELAAVDMTGATIYSNSQTPAIVSCYSSAYDNYSSPGSPKLWLFTQNAGASANDLIMLQEFDINTRTLTGFTMDLFTLSGNMPGYIPGTAAAQTIAGGAASYVNASGKFVLAVNIQQSPNLVVGLELAETGPPLTKDVGVTSIPQPVSGYDLGNAETVSFNLKNIGTNSQSNIPWTVTWNGPSGTQNLNGTAAGPLASGETLLVTAGTANLSQFGEYSFEICSNLAGDENPDNNCKTKSVVNSPAPTLLYPQSAERWTGSTNGTAITETSLVKGANAEDGWFVFDVSSIPVGATITSVKFHGYVYQTNYPYWSLTPLSLNPLTADPAALKAEITANGVTGIAYSYNNETSTFAIGWHEYQLTAAAATDMTADLAQGWFAMGMDSRDNSATYFINFEGWNETNVPYLEVEFTGGTTTVGTPPANFMADFVEGEGVVTTWGNAGEWVRWDSGENAGSLGLEEAGTFWCAARWETADLAPYAGQYITEVNYFPVLYADPPGIKLMIWEGAGFADLVYEQVITNINWDEFNTITLDEMHMIDATKEMMVGFELIQPLGEYPMGYDAGPAVAGKGDLVSLDGITFVSMATEFEIDNNFNIGVYVMAETDGLVGTKQILARNTVSNPTGAFTTQTAKVGGNLNNGTRLEKLGVNIYRNGTKVNGDPVQGNTYTDPFFTPGTYTYTAKTVYDEGLSEPTPPEEVVIPQANEPAISVAPSSLMETHPVNDTITTKTLTISNTGTEPLVWDIAVNTGGTKLSGVAPIDPEVYAKKLAERQAAEGTGTSKHSLGMAPAGSSQPVETP